jgi:hypothetical protein
MSFNDVAIHDGCVTRLDFRRDLVTAFDDCHVLHIFHSYVKAVIFHILNPVVTATSGGGKINGDGNAL